MGGATNGLVSKVGNLTNMFKSFGKGDLVGIALAAAGGLITAIANGIKKSTENTIAWRLEMAKFKPFMDEWDAFLERMGRGWNNITNAIINAINWMTGARKEANEALKLEAEAIRLEQEKANATALEISAQTKLNELKAQVADSDKYNNKQRIEAAQEIDDTLTAQEERRLKNAKAEVELLQKTFNIPGTDTQRQPTIEEQEKYNKALQEMWKIEADNTANQLARAKELRDLRKSAGQEYIDYEYKILQAERDISKAKASLVVQGSDEELVLRMDAADKEYKMAVIQAQKEVKNAELKNKLLEEAEKQHEVNIYQIQQDWYSKQLQMIKDSTDAAVANTVDEWKKMLPKLQGLMAEYNQKLQIGKPATQSSQEWEKELAQMREAIRKTWLQGIDDIFSEADNKIHEKTKANFKSFQEDTSAYLMSEADTYKAFMNQMIGAKQAFIDSVKQLSGETDEQFAERRLQVEREYNNNILELRKKSDDAYVKWYIQKQKEMNVVLLQDNKKILEEYMYKMPHNVWDYLFRPTDNTMANMETDLKIAQSKFEQTYQNITTLMKSLWNEKEDGAFNWNEAFKRLPKEQQEEYLNSLEDLKNKEEKILQQRLDN